MTDHPKAGVAVGRNVSITLATSLVSSAATAAGALIVAHGLGPRGAGLFTLARVVPTVAAVLLGGGVSIANPYFVSRGKHPVQAVAETNLVLALTIGALAWAGWVVVGPAWTTHLFGSEPPTLVAILGASIPILILRNYLASIQQGLHAFTAANLGLFAEDFGAMLFVLPLLAHAGGGPAAEATILLCPLAGAAASLVIIVRDLQRRGIRLRPRLRAELARDLIGFGLRGHLARIANTLSWRLDMIILSTLTSTEAVGYYAVATKIAEVVRPLSGSLNFVLRPLIASLPAAEARAQGVRLLRSFFAINLVAVVVLWVACGHVIVLLFGPQFAPAIPACRLLLVGLVAFGADGVLNGYNVGSGRPELNAYAALLGVLITVVGDLGLIPHYGVVGAALTSAVAYTVKAVALIAIFMAVSRTGAPQAGGAAEAPPEAPPSRHAA